LGSAPTVHLAIQKHFSGIKGIILLSAISSGIKLISPDIKIEQSELEKIDVFCNLEKASEILCPVLIIHGQKDKVIPINQCEELCNKIKNVYKWYPNNGTHSNILTEYRMKFYSQMKYFLDSITLFNVNKDENDRHSSAISLTGQEENLVKIRRSSNLTIISSDICEDEMGRKRKISNNISNSLNAKKLFRVRNTELSNSSLGDNEDKWNLSPFDERNEERLLEYESDNPDSYVNQFDEKALDKQIMLISNHSKM